MALLDGGPGAQDDAVTTADGATACVAVAADWPEDEGALVDAVVPLAALALAAAAVVCVAVPAVASAALRATAAVAAAATMMRVARRWSDTDRSRSCALGWRVGGLRVFPGRLIMLPAWRRILAAR